MRKLEIEGKKFGRLTTIRLISNGKKRIWECRCECGESVITSTSQLVSGNKKSCGCAHNQKLVGLRFGMLVVMARSGYDKKNKRIMWYCVCDCGGSIVTFSRYLQRGTRTDCGCQTKAKYGLHSRKASGFSVVSKVMDSYAGNSKRKGYEFSLDRELFKEIIGRDCHYCGAEAKEKSISKCYGSAKVNGIDRVDNGSGYVPGNVVACCRRCNVMKRDMDYFEFISLVKTIAERFK